MFFSSDTSGEIYVVMKEETSNGTTGSIGGKPTKSGAQRQRLLSTGMLVLSLFAYYVVS